MYLEIGRGQPSKRRKTRMLRKFGIIAVLSLMALALAAVPSLAATATFEPISTSNTGGLHFCQGTTPTVTATKTTTEAFLTSSGEVCGAGTTATATLSGTAVYTTGCINRGSKDQQPSGLQRQSTNVLGSTTFRTRSGRGTFNVESSHVRATDRTCPDRMTPVFVGPVTFENVTLTVTSQTGTATANFGTIDP
jgi:hypothetical protein